MRSVKNINKLYFTVFIEFQLTSILCIKFLAMAQDFADRPARIQEHVLVDVIPAITCNCSVSTKF